MMSLPTSARNLNLLWLNIPEKGRNIILSRRPLLEKIETEKKAALKKFPQQGMTVSGVVTSVQKFGAFVDLGGVQALMPVSEMGWGRG